MMRKGRRSIIRSWGFVLVVCKGGADGDGSERRLMVKKPEGNVEHVNRN